VNPIRRKRFWISLGLTALMMLALRVPLAYADPLTLREAIERALRFAPSIANAAASTDLSDAQMRELRAAMYPAVNASGEYTQSPGYDEVITNRGMTRAQIELNYTAFDFGRRMSKVRAARYALEAARYGIAASRAQIIFDTTVAYLDLMRAKHAVLETQANVDRLGRYVDTIDRLRRTGRAIENDALKVRTTRDAAEIALSDASNDRQRAAEVLGSMIGDFASRDFEITDLVELPKPPAADLAQSPAMRAAIRQIQSSKMEVQAAQEERYPTFQVALTAGALGVDPANTFGDHYGASYDGILSVPIFDGGLITSHIDQAMAKKLQAIAQARAIEYDLRRRIDAALLHYQRALGELSILTRALPNAQDAFALTWTRFLGGGTATLLEVLDAYEQAENLRISRIQQDFEARQSAAEVAMLYGVNQ